MNRDGEDKERMRWEIEGRGEEIDVLEKSVLDLTATLRERDAEIERLKKRVAELEATSGLASGR